MAKSKGNFFTVQDLLEEGYDPVALRYMLIAVHYRKQLNFSDDSLTQARGALSRLRDFLYRLKHDPFPAGKSPEVERIVNTALTNFEQSLDDDLNISGALAAGRDDQRPQQTCRQRESLRRYSDSHDSDSENGSGVGRRCSLPIPSRKKSKMDR
jgi:cysteinyl-tRNA synthetase